MFMWLKKYYCLVLQVLIPIAGIILITTTTNSQFGYGPFPNSRSFEGPTIVYNMGNLRRSAITDIMDFYSGSAVYSDDVENYININYDDNIIGLRMSENNSEIITTIDPHDVTRSLNIFSNMFMKLHMPYRESYITTHYEPMVRGSKPNWRRPKSLYLCLKWCVWLVFLSVLPLAPFTLLSIEERYTGARDVHMMTGCSPTLHWGAKMAAHLVFYIAVVPTTVFIITEVLDFDQTFDNIEFLAYVILLLFVFALAFLSYLYFLSFISNKHYAISQVYVMSLGYGILVPILIEVTDHLLIAYQWITAIFKAFLALAYLCPVYVYSVGLIRLSLEARLNAYCNLNKHMCPKLSIKADGFSTKTCCESTSKTPFSYLTTFPVYVNFLVLLVHFVGYSILVILLEKRIIQICLECILHVMYSSPQKMFNHPGVTKQKEMIKDILYTTKEIDNEVLIVRDVHKQLCKKCTGNAIPVSGFDILAKKGECVGLLGPRGSGKSVILEMLAGSTVMTRGNSWVDGYSLTNDRSKYIRKVAIASNHGGVDMFLSGPQNLNLILQLQGYSKSMAQTMTDTNLRYLGLDVYSKKPVRQYNKKCMRRLGICLVISLSPLVAFIDQPMKDMDPTVRPVVAKALKKLICEPTTVIVAESSLDWSQMESIYDRIGIIIDGQLVAIGPAEEIYKELTTGYIIRVKLKLAKATSHEDTFEEEPSGDLRMESSTDYIKGVNALKDDFKNVFTTSVLMEEHLCMLYFYIKDDERMLLYSEIFRKLHDLKLKHVNVMEHYILNSTTIEDVFRASRKELFLRRFLTKYETADETREVGASTS